MSKNYRHIFFDLDHTLWDYEKNAGEVLYDLYDEFSFATNADFTAKHLVETFHEVNDYLWDQHDKGLINKYHIRTHRFPNVFDRLGHSINEAEAKDFGTKYITRCPSKPHTMPFAHEVLDYLKSKYILHIITNGFQNMQQMKMDSAGISHYFDQLFISEEVGAKKPDLRIFDHALASTGASSDEALMIGDNLIADIGGARNARWDQVYFNPKQIPHQQEVTYEIQTLNQLQEFL